MTFLSLDMPALLTALFASISCAILGNYLVLRKLSLMGDAISHSVLPGIVVAFLLTSSRDSLSVFIGASIAGIASALLIELVRKYGRVESGASMGVVFSIFFAAGVILIEQAAARSIDLDAECLLHGQLESIFWFPPTTSKEFFQLKTLQLIPSDLYSSFFTMVLSIAFVSFLYKELKIASFDPALSSSLGFNSTLLYQALMVMVACSVVASFKAVGSILVISMIICPAATSRLYTDKLKTQILLSVVFATISTLLGYYLGGFAPLALGFENSISISGMIAVCLGLVLALSSLIAPRYGLFSRMLRRAMLSVKVRQDDILALLYRSQELAPETASKGIDQELIFRVFGPDGITRVALESLSKVGQLIRPEQSRVMLSKSGLVAGSKVVRTHRLWETYLVKELGLSPDHVHETAEKLEHFDQQLIEEKVVSEEDYTGLDPHGSPIPELEPDSDKK